jgi:phage tail sheath gpL-like
MTPYWIANLVMWSAVLAYAAPAAVAAILGSQRRGDPMRLATALVALVMVAGNARWLFGPTEETLWKAVLTMSFLTGGYVVTLMRAYGRGEDL